MAEWISVDDRLPKWENREDSQSYYVYLENSFWVKHAVWLYVGNGKWYREDIDSIETGAVTHWLPLHDSPDPTFLSMDLSAANGWHEIALGDSAEVEVTQDEFFGNNQPAGGAE